MALKLKIQLGLIAILVISALSLILSQSASPDFPPLFALKRIQEKAFLSLKSNPSDRVDYMNILLDRRLDELNSQVRRQSYGYILPSALRYFSTAGQITEAIISQNLKDQVASQIQKFNNHGEVLQKIYVLYPKNTDNVEYKYIEDDINYLELYIDMLLNFFNAEKALSTSVFPTITVNSV